MNSRNWLCKLQRLNLRLVQLVLVQLVILITLLTLIPLQLFANDATEELASKYLNYSKTQLLTELLITKKDLYVEKQNVIKLTQELNTKNTEIIDLNSKLINANGIIISKNNAIDKLVVELSKKRKVFPVLFGNFGLGYSINNQLNSFGHGLNVHGKINIVLFDRLVIFGNVEYKPVFNLNQFYNFGVNAGLEVLLY